jgi:hypothetical protein
MHCQSPHRRGVAFLAVLALTAALTVSLVVRATDIAGGVPRGVRMTTGDGGATRWVNLLVDEESLAVAGAHALQWTSFVRDPDVPALPGVMARAYDRMRAAVGSVPSPFVATYLGLERPGEEDTLVIGDPGTSEGVVVFLHGYAGSFTLPCWVVADAAKDAGFATVCPATRWVGDWWSPAGEATLRATVERLHRSGVRRVVLAGLSNGGVGASLLAPRMRGTFDGLILLSGASPDAASPGVPVLAVQGVKDAQIPAEVVRAYAARVHGRYVPLAAGHFALLMEETQAHGAIASFLAGLARGSGPKPATRSAAP